MRCLRWCSLLLLGSLLLGGCTVIDFRKGARKEAVENFTRSLRWQMYPAAASYFSAELQAPFLAQLETRKGLNVTDVRLVRAEVKEEGARVDTRLEMDYYLLPSTRLKTLRIDQVWRHRAEVGGFVITTPFPPLP